MRSLINPIDEQKQTQRALSLYQQCDEFNEKGACMELKTTGLLNKLAEGNRYTQGYSEGGEPLIAPIEEEYVEEASNPLIALMETFEPAEQEQLMQALEAFPIVEKLAYMAYKTEDGLVKGAGTSTSDEVPARVSDGEFILSKEAVDMIGLDKLEELNSMAQQRVASMV